MSNNVEIETKEVKIKNQDLALDGYLALPVGEGKFPAVVVIQEIFGVNDHIRDVTRRFAEAGYVAIAPAIYQRLAPGFETGYTQEAVKLGKEYKSQTKAAELLRDIQSTINYLYTLEQVKAEGVGCIGFCFGGHVAYLVATLKEIKATASFYGAGITNWSPGEGEPTISVTSQIKGSIWAFFGLDDASIPVSQIDEIEEALTTHNIPHKIWRYPGADHGFFCDQRGSYNLEAAKQAWFNVLDLFSKTL